MTAVEVESDSKSTSLAQSLDQLSEHCPASKELVQVLLTECPRCSLRCPGISQCPLLDNKLHFWE